MMMPVRSRALTWILAGLVALAIVAALIVALAGNGNEAGDGAAAEEPAAANTSVTEVAAPDPSPGSATLPPPPAATTTTTFRVLDHVLDHDHRTAGNNDLVNVPGLAFERVQPGS